MEQINRDAGLSRRAAAPHVMSHDLLPVLCGALARTMRTCRSWAVKNVLDHGRETPGHHRVSGG